MISETKIKQISKEAGLLYSAINRGMINVPQVRDFLARVESLDQPLYKNLKKRERIEDVNTYMK